jgi:CubicO group peptidase (beta-lactamase class C family)
MKILHVLLLIGALFSSATATSQPTSVTSQPTTAASQPTTAASQSTASQPDAIPLSPVSQRVKNLCADLEKRGKFSGSLFVKTPAGIELDEAMGNADSALSIPNTPETAYRIGAITRIFTATAVLKLAANNQLNLEDTLQQHLPKPPIKNSSKITLHSLLSNASGIPDYLPTWKTAWHMRNGANQPPANGSQSLLASLANLDLRFEPGTKAEHSSSNAMLLGRILEKQANAPLPTILKKLFEDIGLTKTGFEIDNEVPTSGRATGYTNFAPWDPRVWLSGDSKNPRVLRHPDWDMAASGAYSTTRDVAQWVDAFWNETLLPLSWRDKMIAKHISKSATRWFGYGWEIHLANNREGLVLTGAHPGYQSIVVFVPQTQTTVVVLENFGDTPSGRTRFFRDIINATLQ